MIILCTSVLTFIGEGGLHNKGRYGCAGLALGILGVNFCLDWSWEVNFARALGFGQFLTKSV